MFLKKRIPFPFIDIYLIQWKKTYISGIHDHAKHGCLLFLYSGKLKEKFYNHQIKHTKTNYLYPFNLSFMHNQKGFHNIESLEDSLSIHLYYPKLHQTKYYQEFK